MFHKDLTKTTFLFPFAFIARLPQRKVHNMMTIEHSFMSFYGSGWFIEFLKWNESNHFVNISYNFT